MMKLVDVAKKNHVASPTVRRYSLPQLISESYNLLYNCEIDSPLYKLTMSHIENVNDHPTKIEEHSENLCYLKSFARLGESLILEDEEAGTTPDATLKDEGPKAELSEEEDENLLENEEENEEDYEDLEETDEEEEESLISPEELQELKSHLKAYRRRKRESAEIEKEGKEKEDTLEESTSWASEKSAMIPALKNFRAISSNKAFYKSINKLAPRLVNKKNPLTMSESITLYKATNSALTHLAVELEHNPGFIYTFKECTNLLAADTKALLECIRNNKVPDMKLQESFRQFASVLLENEEFEDDEDAVFDDESVEECDSSNMDKKIIKEEEDEEIPPEDVETPEEETLEEEENSEEEEIPEEVPAEEPVKENEEEEEIPADVETPEESENQEEDSIEEEEDSEDITDEEAEELRKKLMEMRSKKKK